MQLPQDDFFNINLVHDRTELEPFFNTRKLWRKAAHRVPLIPSHILQPRDRWAHLDFPWATINSEHTHRSVPSLLLRDDFTAFESQFEFTLETQLQGGDDKNAQVWTAFMALQNSPSEVEPARVVVKIFQESLSRAEEISLYAQEDPEFESSILGKWLFSSRVARNEAWAYFRMRKMQGWEIPWSFGFFKFRLQSGEHVIAHIMEYIDAAPTELIPSLSQDAFSDMLDAIASTIHKMHAQCGVSQGDMNPSNKLIRHPSIMGLAEGNSVGRHCAPPVVFIDFGHATNSTDLEVAREFYNAMVFLATSGPLDWDTPMLKGWCEERTRQHPVWVSLIANMELAVKAAWVRLESVMDKRRSEMIDDGQRG